MTNETSNGGNSRDAPTRRPHRWRDRIIAGVVGALLGGTAVGTLSHAGPGWCGHGPWTHARQGMQDPARVHERAEFGAEWVLSRIDADETQKAQVKAVVRAAIDDLRPLRERHEANRAAWLELLTAPAVDRGAVEALRAEELELAEQASARLARALADVADVLTPEQRAALAERIRRFRG